MNFIDWTHFDPVNALFIGLVAYGTWIKVRETVRQQGAWIIAHDAKDDEREKVTNEIKDVAVRLTALMEGHERRIEMLENRAEVRTMGKGQ